MAFLARFFKSKAPVELTLEQRIANLEPLSTEARLQIACGTETEALRIAAIKLLPYSANLRSLALKDSSSNIARAAQTRLGELYENTSVSMNALLDGITDTAEQLLLTQFSPKASLAIIDQISDEKSLLNLATAATVANVRQAAANKILGHAELTELLKASKGKDKAVYRLVKSKLDAHKEETAQQQERLEAVTALCENVELMGRCAYTPQFAGKLKHLQTRWQAIKVDSDAATLARTEAAFSTAEARIESEAAALAAQAQAEKTALLSKEQAQQDAQQASEQYLQEQTQIEAEQNEKISARLTELNDKISEALQEPTAQVKAQLAKIYAAASLDGELFERIKAELAQTRQSVNDALANLNAPAATAEVNAEPTAELNTESTEQPDIDSKFIAAATALQEKVSKEFDHLYQQAEATLQQCFESGSVQALLEKLKGADTSNDAATVTDSAENSEADYRALDKMIRAAKNLDAEAQPEAISQAQQLLQKFHATKKELQQKAEVQRRQLSDLLRRGLHAVEDSNLRRVAGISKDVERLVKDLGTLPAGLANKVEDLKSGLDKLRDWHSFAVEPKKQALLEKMRSLIGSALHPADLASQVQRLQEEWKTFSKGGKDPHPELWQEFQTAANAAYEPCHEHFGEQAVLREQNLIQRQQLLQQLESYIANNDWENASWPDVEKTRQVAREEWRRYSPVARNVNDALQKSFNEIMDNISAKITAHYQQGKKAKLELIEQAQQLASSDDIGKAISAIKGLQARWKTAGRCDRKDDQQLWSEFRAHCDTVFERRSKETEAENIEQAANQASAETVLAALEELQTLNGQAYLDSLDQLQTLTDEFHAIGELPRASRAQISARFRKLQNDLQGKAERERRQLQDNAWQAVFSASDAVREFEWANTDASKAAAEQALNDARENLPNAAKAALHSITQRFENPAHSAEQQTENNKALEQLCLRAEILTELETPAAFKAQRMQYQIELLSQGLGNSDKIDSDSAHSYTLEWLATGAGTKAQQAILWQRLSLCLDVMNK